LTKNSGEAVSLITELQYIANFETELVSVCPIVDYQFDLYTDDGFDLPFAYMSG
jgi:hypothetical protein